MTRRYTHTLSLSLGGDEPVWEGEVTVTYVVHPARPAAPPSYASGGDPPEPALVEDITVTHIDGAVVVGGGLSDEARTLEAVIEGSDALLAVLLQEAAETDAADYDDAMGRRYEAARDDRGFWEHE